jgi:hypothetical protein
MHFSSSFYHYSDKLLLAGFRSYPSVRSESSSFFNSRTQHLFLSSGNLFASMRNGVFL